MDREAQDACEKETWQAKNKGKESTKKAGPVSRFGLSWAHFIVLMNSSVNFI